MKDLVSIIYISTAHISVTQEDIEQILRHAREQNKINELTGMLLYCNGTFMQYIEGPKENIDSVYSKIKMDDRHHGIMQYFYSEIESRIFFDWTMAYSAAPQTFLDEITNTYLSSKHEKDQIVHMLLSDFWKGNTK